MGDHVKSIAVNNELIDSKLAPGFESWARVWWQMSIQNWKEKRSY